MKKIFFFFLLLAFGLELSAQSGEFNCATETWNTKCGVQNGKVVIYVEGGKTPYTFLIIDNQTGKTLLSETSNKTSVEVAGLGPGTYYTKVVDADGSIYEHYKGQIDPSTNPILSLVSKQDENCGNGDGWILLKGTGGIAPYSFKLKSSGKESFSGKFENLKAGNDTIILTDGHGCIDAESIKILSVGKIKTQLVSTQTCDQNKVNVKTDTLFKGSTFLGCDSFAIAQYISVKIVNTTETKISCDLNFAGKRDSFNYVSINGCDSIHTITWLYKKQDDTKITKESCVKSGTIDSLKLFNQYGCDSLVIVSWVPRQIKTTSRKENTCELSQVGFFPEKLQTNDGCDSVIVVERVFKNSDTTRLTFNVCGLKKPSHNEFNLVNRFGCDSLVVIDSFRVNAISIQLPLTRTCDKSLSGNFIDTLSTIYGCDSIVKWSVSYAPPTRKVNLSYECDKSKSGVFPKFLQNQYGCDSTVIDSVVYAGSKITVLATKEFCGVKNSDTLVDSLFTNIYGCDSVVRQRIIEKESPVITENGYTHPTSKWNGSANFTVVGGTAPYQWMWSNSATKASVSGLKGGVYTAVVSDTKGCRDTAEVRLSDFWASSSKPGIVMIHGGLADKNLIDLYGSEYGDLSLCDSNGKMLYSKTMYMPDEFLEEIPVQVKGVIIALMTLPNGFLLSKVNVH